MVRSARSTDHDVEGVPAIPAVDCAQTPLRSGHVPRGQGVHLEHPEVARCASDTLGSKRDEDCGGGDAQHVTSIALQRRDGCGARVCAGARESRVSGQRVDVIQTGMFPEAGAREFSLGKSGVTSRSDDSRVACDLRDRWLGGVEPSRRNGRAGFAVVLNVDRGGIPDERQPDHWILDWVVHPSTRGRCADLGSAPIAASS